MGKTPKSESPSFWSWAAAGVAAVLLAGGAALAGPAATELYQESYELEAAGKNEEALGRLHALPEAQRSTYFYRLREGWLYSLLGKHGGAGASSRAAARVEPSAVEPRLGAMLPEMALGLWRDAERDAREVLKIAPRNYLASSRLAFVLFSLGRYQEAEKFYRAVVADYPADLEMRAGVGWSLLKQGKRVDAARMFAEILAVSPRFPAAASGAEACRPAQ